MGKYQLQVVAMYLILAAAKWDYGGRYVQWCGYIMCITDIICLWIYSICILCTTNNSDCGFTKTPGWPLSRQK